MAAVPHAGLSALFPPQRPGCPLAPEAAKPTGPSSGPINVPALVQSGPVLGNRFRGKRVDLLGRC